MMIFHSYVSLPEGNHEQMRLHGFLHNHQLRFAYPAGSGPGRRKRARVQQIGVDPEKIKELEHIIPSGELT